MLRQSMLLATGLMAFAASFCADARNVVFLNNPSPQNVSEIGKYVVRSTGKPFFSDLVLFAANINGSTPNTPVLYYNSQMSTILDNNIAIVRQLQSKGIKVQIAYLGNHQNAGWSCNMSNAAANNLGTAMVNDVVRYGLDGIDVDDEYSTCSGNASAFYTVLGAIRSNTRFSGKTLSKALWSDSSYFNAPYNAATKLTEGYEMTYNGNVANLTPYVNAGMAKGSLFLGISPEFSSASQANTIARNVANGGYQGVMVWAPNAFFSSTATAAQYYTQILRGQTGSTTQVVDYVP